MCGAAYERLGLVWAARGTTLTAASVATNEFWTYSDVTTLQASCYRRMKWLKLYLRDAWAVGKNDLDSVGILPDDDPIIPADKPNAPVLELLEGKRNQS